MSIQTIDKYFVKAPPLKKGRIEKVVVGDPQNHWGLVYLPVPGQDEFQAVVRLELDETKGRFGFSRGWEPVDLPSGVYAIDIDCAADGTVIMVGSDHHLYRYLHDSGQFRKIKLKDDLRVYTVSVGSNDQIFFTTNFAGTSSTVHRYLGEGYSVPYNFSPDKIAVGSNGTLMGYTFSYRGENSSLFKIINQHSYATLYPLGKSVGDISVGSDLSIYFTASLKPKKQLLYKYLMEAIIVQVNPIWHQYTKPTDPKKKMGTFKNVEIPGDYFVYQMNSSGEKDLAIVTSTKYKNKGGSTRYSQEAYFSVDVPA